MLLIFSKLVVVKPLVAIIALMHNFIVKFGKILDIFKEFAGNRVNNLGNVPRRGVVPRFSDLEVLALSATVEVFGIDSENYLFYRLRNECADRFPNLITRRQYNQRRKLTYRLGEEIRKDIAAAMDGSEDVFSIGSKPVKVCQNARATRCAMGGDTPELSPAWGYCASQNMHYYGYKFHAVRGISGVIHSYDMTAANVHDLHYLQDVKWQYHDCLMLGDKGYLSADIQQNLFDVAHISQEVPYRLNQKNWRPPIWAYRKFRKRIEMLFSQLNDQFLMICNYAKQPKGLFTRIAAKVSALTVLQYVNYINHRKIDQVKYALI